MSKIYMCMYCYIGVNLLTDVKKTPQVKLHCVHMNFIARCIKCISQLTSVISWYLLSKDASAMAKNEETLSKCSWDNPNERHMEKGDIISLVGKNCTRDIHWGPVTWLQSRSCEFEPMHSRISFMEISHKIIFMPKRAKVHFANLLCIHMLRNTLIQTCVNVNILLHLVRPRCIFTRVQMYSGMYSHSHAHFYICV